MRLPWKHKDEEIVSEPLPRKRETLRQVSEKILIRKMRKDPDGFGIEVAKRVTGAHEPEPRSVMSQLKELKELKSAITELSDGESGGIWKDVMSVIATTLPETLKQMQPQQTQQQPVINKPLQQVEYRQIDKPPKEPPKVSLANLTELIDKTPEDAYQALKGLYPQWIDLLKLMTVDELIAQVRQFQDTTPEVIDVIEKFESEDGRTWLEKLINLAKVDK